MYLGTFQMGEQAIVTDPCYEASSASREGGGKRALSLVLDTIPGEWATEIVVERQGSWGNRVSVLEAYHRGMTSGHWELVAGGLGVDSGQMGIFDFAKYPVGDPGDYDDKTSFYGRVCELTYSDDDPGRKGGVTTEGVCSSSGYGDGSYPCYVRRNADGKVCAIRVVFINEDEDGEETDDYEDDSYDPDDDRSPDSSDGPDRPEF